MCCINCLKNITYCLACVLIVHVEIAFGGYGYKFRSNSDASEAAAAPGDSSDWLQLPERFELSGPGAVKNFATYVHNIENVANKQMLTVKYKVSVETTKDVASQTRRRLKLGKRPKKFNVPLKKESMKLSSFEILMTKRAEDRSSETTTEAHTTTETWAAVPTKPVQTGKYKPIIGGLRSRFHAKVAPVKMHVISLNTTSPLGFNERKL